jgi:hypothetical protein
VRGREGRESEREREFAGIERINYNVQTAQSGLSQQASD